jgi:putative hydrolase of the HAD superfamily
MIEAPQVVVFDMGGVLCRWLPDRRLVALAELAGVPPDQIDQLLFESGWDDACERGQFDLRELLDQLRSLLGMPASPTTDLALRRAWAAAFEPDRSVLRVIPSIDPRTALFTNNGPLLEQALHHELAVVPADFQHLLFSWRIGATKPDPAAFAGATAALDVEPGEVFFIDDSGDNVAAAEAFGWRAHRYTDALNLRAALSDVGALGGKMQR